MRTAEITARGRVEIVDRPLPQGRAASGDLRVRMLAVGICGTDQSLATGRRLPPEFPWRLGHEGIGEVAEVGSDADGFVVGDRVALEPNITCGRCEYCTRDTSSACASRLSSGVLTQPGLLAEVVDHPSEFCHRLEGSVPLERAVCAEPLAVAAAAIRRTELKGVESGLESIETDHRRTGLEGADGVLVLGAGAQGLLSILILVSRGYNPYISEPNEERRALAVELGAQVFTPATSCAPEFVIDAAGAPEALGAVVHQLAPFASITLVGEDHHRLGASSFDIVQKQLRIKGSFIYEHPQDMADAVSLLAEMPTEKIMGPAMALEDVPNALAAGRPNRVGVKSSVSVKPGAGLAHRVGVEQAAGVAHRAGVEHGAGLAHRVGVEQAADLAHRVGVEQAADLAHRVGVERGAGVKHTAGVKQWVDMRL